MAILSGGIMKHIKKEKMFGLSMNDEPEFTVNHIGYTVGTGHCM